VFGDGQSDAGDVRLLEGVGAYQFASHLSGDADNGGGVHHGCGDSRHHIGGAGPGSGNRYAHFSAGARVAVRHVRRALLVPHQDVMDGAVLKRVISRQNRPARVAKHMLYAFTFQALPKNLRTRLSHTIPVPLF